MLSLLSFFRAFADPLTFGWSALIAIFFLFCTLLTVRASRSLIENLRSACSIVAQMEFNRPDSVNLVNQQLWDLPDIGVQFRQYGSHIYSESHEAAGASTAFVSLRAPEEFFNEGTLLQSRINGGLFRAVPGILTGLGILGTFIGLIIGLGASETLTGGKIDNVAALVESVQTLLSSAGFAFVTSVVGLFFSLVFTWLLHREQYRIRSVIRQFCVILEGQIHVLSPEELLMKAEIRGQKEVALMRRHALILSQTQDSLSNQSVVAGEFNKQTLSGLESVARALDALRRDSQFNAQEQAKLLSAAVEKAFSNIDSSLSNQIDALSSSFKSASEGMGSAVSSLNAVISSMQAQINHSVEESGKCIVSMTEATRTNCEAIAQSGSELSERFNALSLNLKNASDTLGPTLEKSNELLGELSKMQSDIHASHTALLNVLGDIDKLGAKLEDACTAIEMQIEAGAASMTEAQSAVEKHLTGAADRLSSQTAAVTAEQKQMMNDIRELRGIVSESLTALGDSMRSMNRSLKENLQDADTELSKAVKLLTKAVDDWYARSKPSGTGSDRNDRRFGSSR